MTKHRSYDLDVRIQGWRRHPHARALSRQAVWVDDRLSAQLVHDRDAPRRERVWRARIGFAARQLAEPAEQPCGAPDPARGSMRSGFLPSR